MLSEEEQNRMIKDLNAEEVVFIKSLKIYKHDFNLELKIQSELDKRQI